MILRKIIKIATTRCHISQQKCTKFDFGWGSAPDPAGGAYRPLAGFKKPTSKGRGVEGKGWDETGGEEREREGKGDEGSEGEKRGGEGREEKECSQSHPL